jgi:16S rRNA (guanine966-N2)-methyltransferase
MSRRSASARDQVTAAMPPILARPRSSLLADLPRSAGKGFAEKALASLRDGAWLTPGALVVVEEAKAAAFAAPDGYREVERRAYDDTEFVFLRRAD